MLTNQTENSIVFRTKDDYRNVFSIEEDGMHWRLIDPNGLELAHTRHDPSDAIELQKFLEEKTLIWDKEEI